MRCYEICLSLLSPSGQKLKASAHFAPEQQPCGFFLADLTQQLKMIKAVLQLSRILLEKDLFVIYQTAIMTDCS